MMRGVSRFVCATALLLMLAPAAAQQKLPRIGWLSLASSAAEFPEKHVLDGLRELGWVDGKTAHIEFRHAAGDAKRLSDFATDLAQSKPDLIVTYSAGVPVAKKATSTIPVVFGTSQDPVRTAYVASLAKPGANLTGVTYLTDDLAAKRLELVKDTLRNVSRVAVLWEPSHVDNELKGLQTAASSFGVRLQPVDIARPPRPDELERVMAAAVDGRAEAIIIAPSGFTIANRKKIAELAAKSRIPVLSAWSIFADDGALITYGPNLQEISRRVASHIDRVLKGAKPESLPIETPTKFELVVNQRAAKALGITIPPQVLQRADRIIQ